VRVKLTLLTRRPCLVAVLMAIGSVAVARAARGDWNPAHTIEWMTADSDVVIRCRLIELADGWRDQAGNPWRKAVLEVSEPMKGPTQPGMRVTVPFSQNNTNVSTPLEEWERKGGERLLFLVDSARTDEDRDRDTRFPYALRSTSVWRWCIWPQEPWHEGKTAIAHTMELKAVTSFEAACSATRAAVAEEGAQRPRGVRGRTGAITLRVPFDSPLSWFVLPYKTACVPLDHRLERLAQSWASDPGRRDLVVGVLSHFQSDQNADILKGFLNDGVFQVHGDGRAATWHHHLRGQAYETLLRWGVNVPRPPLNQPADTYRPARKTLLFVGIAAAAAILVASAFVTLRLRRYSPRPLPTGRLLLNAATLALLLATVAAGVLWRRSATVVDELTFCTQDSRCWLSSFQDGIELTRIKGWQRRCEIQYGAFRVGEAPLEFWYPGSEVRTTGAYWRGFRHAAGTVTFTPVKEAGFTRGPLHFDRWKAPGWSLVIVAGTLPLLRLLSAVWRRVRRRRRLASGCCSTCGYDLRASAGKCPECGEATPASQRMQ
jgi:hypothetical protein